MMLIICVFGGALALYILFTAIDPLRKMDQSMQQLCHKAKYLAALAVAFWVLAKAMILQLDWLHLLMALCIALFIWPRTLYDMRQLWNWPPKWH